MRYTSITKLMSDGYVLTHTFNVEIKSTENKEYFLYDETSNAIILCFQEGRYPTCKHNQIMLTEDTQFIVMRYELVGSDRDPIYVLKPLTEKNCHLKGRCLVIDYETLVNTFNNVEEETKYFTQLRLNNIKEMKDVNTVCLGKIDLTKYAGEDFAVFKYKWCECIFDDEPFEQGKKYKYFIIPQTLDKSGEDPFYCIEINGEYMVYEAYNFTDFFLDVTPPTIELDIAQGEIKKQFTEVKKENMSTIETNIYR